MDLAVFGQLLDLLEVRIWVDLAVIKASRVITVHNFNAIEPNAPRIVCPCFESWRKPTVLHQRIVYLPWVGIKLGPIGQSSGTPAHLYLRIKGNKSDWWACVPVDCPLMSSSSCSLSGNSSISCLVSGVFLGRRRCWISTYLLWCWRVVLLPPCCAPPACCCWGSSLVPHGLLRHGLLRKCSLNAYSDPLLEPKDTQLLQLRHHFSYFPRASSLNPSNPPTPPFTVSPVPLVTPVSTSEGLLLLSQCLLLLNFSRQIVHSKLGQ